MIINYSLPFIFQRAMSNFFKKYRENYLIKTEQRPPQQQDLPGEEKNDANT